MRQSTTEMIQAFESHLYFNEKSNATVEKYMLAVPRLAEFLDGRELTKTNLLDYREHLQAELKAQTVNGALSAIHAFLDFSGWQECQVKLLKVQQQAFLEEAREMSEKEYRRLLAAAQAKGNERLYPVMLTICGTGIRVSELLYITVEAVESGRAQIHMKGKSRTIPRRSGESIVLTSEMRAELLAYIRRKGIKDGLVFRTASGRVLDRKNVHWLMNSVCATAQVAEEKVSPRTLQRMYQQTRAEIHERVVLQAERDFQQLLFTEQRLFGWEEKKVARLP